MRNICNVQCAMCSVQCAVCSVQCAVCSVLEMEYLLAFFDIDF